MKNIIMKHIKKFEDVESDYLKKAEEYKTRHQQEREKLDKTVAEFDKIKLNKYLVYKSLSTVFLCEIYNTDKYHVFVKIHYRYNNDDNTIEKTRNVKNSRGLMLSKEYMEKNILLNTDDKKEAIDYIQRLYDSKRYNL